MTKEEIRQEALKAEKERFPRCAGDKDNSFHGVNSAYGLGFVDGALWARDYNKSPWISVEDDLPCNHEDMVNVFVEHVELRTDCVLTMSDEGYISIDYMKKLGPWPWHWSGIEKTTHWMPIPKLPKE